MFKSYIRAKVRHHQRHLVAPCLHIGVVRACECVHDVGVAFPGGKHQRRHAVRTNITIHDSLRVSPSA